MNSANPLVLTVTVLLAFALVATGAPASVSAQYLGNDGAGKVDASTLEEVLKIKSDQVENAELEKYPPTPGSGTIPLPHPAPFSVFVFIGIVVGIAATVFFVKGRTGRYAAMGK